MRQEVIYDIDQSISQSYDQLDGEWREWLDVAKRYEHRVPTHDRLDIRHDIIIELYHARQRDQKPIPLLRAYRIASFTVAQYWREVVKRQVKACIYDGLPKEPHCQACSHKVTNGHQCPYLALRPIQSLDDEVTDSEGNRVRLKDTIADDHAIDLEVWLNEATWRLGCPMRLVQIANKRLNGQALTNKEHQYLWRFRQKEQKRLF